MRQLAVDRTQTLGEEIANATSHGIALLFAVASMPFLVARAAEQGSAASVVGVSVFSATMIVLYLVSTLYHALPAGAAKRWFNRFDHCAIYVFIAGSYTPFVLGVLRGGWGWSLFGVVWRLAALGVSAKLLNRLSHPLLSTAFCVAMGWVALAAVVPLVQRMPAAGLAWLVGGGVAYTVGALVYLLDGRMRYAHFVWHLFVLAGSTCHFIAALLCAQ